MTLTLKKNAIYDFSSWEDNVQWDEMVGGNKPLEVIMRASIQGTGTVSMACTSTGVQRFLIAYPLKGTGGAPPANTTNFFTMFS